MFAWDNFIIYVLVLVYPEITLFIVICLMIGIEWRLMCLYWLLLEISVKPTMWIYFIVNDDHI